MAVAGGCSQPSAMEAIALHDFHATAEDELSFKKGSILKVSDLVLLHLRVRVCVRLCVYVCVCVCCVCMSV